MSEETGKTAGQEREEEPREWIFSFGYGQTLKSVSSSGTFDPNPQGVPLDNCIVRINGTFAGAREKMIAIFGWVWCDQYAELPDVPACPWVDLTGMLDATEAVRKLKAGEFNGE